MNGNRGGRWCIAIATHFTICAHNCTLNILLYIQTLQSQTLNISRQQVQSFIILVKTHYIRSIQWFMLHTFMTPTLRSIWHKLSLFPKSQSVLLLCWWASCAWSCQLKCSNVNWTQKYFCNRQLCVKNTCTCYTQLQISCLFDLTTKSFLISINPEKTVSVQSVLKTLRIFLKINISLWGIIGNFMKKSDPAIFKFFGSVGKGQTNSFF